MYDRHQNLGILDSIRGHSLSGGSGYKPASIETYIGLIILVLLLNLLTDDQQKNLYDKVVAAITPKPVTMPAPTKWVVRNGMAYQVQSYAPY